MSDMIWVRIEMDAEESTEFDMHVSKEGLSVLKEVESLSQAKHRAYAPYFRVTVKPTDGADGGSSPFKPQNQFLTELANLVQKHGADFYYTTADDGIHIMADGVQVFTGFSLTPELLRAAVKEPTHV